MRTAVLAIEGEGFGSVKFKHGVLCVQYLDILASDKKDRALLLEFVKDDSDAQLREDAKTLIDWRKNYAV